jgi:ribonuclease Z
MIRFELLVLGSSSATPMYGRHPTAQLIDIGEQLFLIDCGEGTQMRLSKFGVKQNKIKAIFISHLHGDHYLGLMGLLSSMHLMGRKHPLTVFGPPGLKEIMELQFQYSETAIRYPLTFIQTKTDTCYTLYESEQFTVQAFPLDHRIPCTGFRFNEKPRLPSLKAELVQQLGVPKSYYKLLKTGHDFVDATGNTHRWQDLTMPSPAPRSFAFCSDTVDSGSYWDAIEGVDLLYHEATFLHEMQARAAETFHTTALQAGQIAEKVNAKKLLIGHYSARYRELDALLFEAQTAFSHTELALEGHWYTIG